MKFTKVLPHGVYAVGGFTRDAVRDALRTHGFDLSVGELERAVRDAEPIGDVDLAGVLSERELSEVLGSRYVQAVNERTGTVIVTDGVDAYEYTRFREEQYAEDGAHEPISVVFHTDLVRDARRRDFACNAIYFEPASGRLFDPMGGIDDLRNGILRAVNGEQTLRYDGLRILRLVRFCATSDLRPDATTERLARSYIGLLDAIPRERVYKELLGMLTPSAARRAVGMLRDYGLIRQLFERDVEDWPCVERADRYCIEAFFADVAGRDESLAARLCRRTRVPNHVSERVRAICRATDPEQDMASLAEHLDVCVDALGADSPAGRYLAAVAASGAPVSVRTMAVNGEDVMALGVSGRAVGELLKRLQAKCVADGIANDRATLLNILKELV